MIYKTENEAETVGEGWKERDVMNSEVHMPIGLAAAGMLSAVIPVMRPDSLETAAGLAVCGAVGALTPDIDANGDSKMKREFRKFVFWAAIIIAVSLRYGTSMHVLSGFKWWNIVGLVALIGCYIYGYTTKHRTFTHELRGLIAFGVPAFMLLGIQGGMWFMIGMLSHQLADMCNYGKIHWLSPVDREKNFSRGWFRGTSLESRLIGSASWIVCFFLLWRYMTYLK